MNILFTSSGRRVELLKLARKTLSDNGITGSIIAADADRFAPTFKFCDSSAVISKISSENYIGELLDVCAKFKVDILIPTIDPELIAISRNVKSFEERGVLVNISTAEVVNICRDKFNTQKFFETNGIKAPKLISADASPEAVQYPAFIKPFDGSSSINAFRINCAKEFDFFRTYIKNPIIQEAIDGEEFTIDAFCDFSAKPITIVPRRRIAVRSGEIQKGRVEKDRDIISASANLLSKLRPFGQTTIQCIRNGSGVFFTEINARFGGGAPMSITAGANSILNLIRLKRGEKLSYNEDWQDAVTFARFDDSVVI